MQGSQDAGESGRRGVRVEGRAEEDRGERERLKNLDIRHNILTSEITVRAQFFPLHLRLIEQRMIVVSVMVIKVNLVC